MTLTFGTWNIHGGLAANGAPVSVRKTQQTLRLLPLDVIALQELEFDCDSDSLSPESQQIIDSIGLAHFTGFPTSPSQFQPDRRFGVGILSRFPIFHVRRSHLPNPNLFAYRSARKLRSHDKGILSGRVITSMGSVTVCSIHLIPFHMFDLQASHPVYGDVWVAAAHELAAVTARLAVAGGDFNTNDRTLLLNRISSEIWRSAAPEVISRPNSSECFDDILLTSGLVLSHLDVIPTFSDHHLLVAHLCPP